MGSSGEEMGGNGGPEWGLSCQEGFELLGGVLGAAGWGYGGNRLKSRRTWGRYGMKMGEGGEIWGKKGKWSQVGRKWGDKGGFRVGSELSGRL